MGLLVLGCALLIANSLAAPVSGASSKARRLTQLPLQRRWPAPKKNAGQRGLSGILRVSNQTKTELCVTVSIFSEPWFLSIPRSSRHLRDPEGHRSKPSTYAGAPRIVNRDSRFGIASDSRCNDLKNHGAKHFSLERR